MWQSWLNFTIGLWLIICGFVPSLHTPASMIVPGALAFIFGFWSTARVQNWEGNINGILGVWLFLSGIWFHLYLSRNFFIVGGIITILSVWNLAEHPDPSQVPHIAE